MTTIEATERPSFSEAFKVWLQIGCINFGGPAAQIALMHRVVVDEKKWVEDARFLHALNFCMLLPGPEATQLAIYIGWLLHKTLGGIVAGALFVIPVIGGIIVSTQNTNIQEVPIEDVIRQIFAR